MVHVTLDMQNEADARILEWFVKDAQGLRNLTAILHVLKDSDPDIARQLLHAALVLYGER